MSDLFVVQGDLTQIRADVVVLSTSVYLAEMGDAFPAFQRRFDATLGQRYAAERDRLGPARGDGAFCDPGHAFTVELSGGPPFGLVMVAAAGGELPIQEVAQRAVRGALREARRLLEHLPRAPGQRALVALPAIGHGGGGYTPELLRATEVLLRTAAEEAAIPLAVPGGTAPLDVAFVAYTSLSYRIFLEARRAAGLEPPCPLEAPEASELLDHLRGGRCVAFVGAGLSRAAGLPDWAGLLRELATGLGLTLADNPDAYPIDFSLDLAQWFADAHGRERLDALVHDRFRTLDPLATSVQPTLAHYFLAALPFRLFLTTNYDDLLERTLTALRRDPVVVTEPEEVVRTGGGERPAVLKVHGDANRRTPVVLTRDDFDGFFRDHPVTAALLEGLLLNHTFLFVGYDLRDPNTRQIYAQVAHLLGRSNRRAYTVVVRGEDDYSQFYEAQWRRQGLVTLRMPAEPDRIHASLRFFDWLARHGAPAPSLFLQADLAPKDLPAEFGGLESLRSHLQALVFPVVEAVLQTRSGEPERARLLATVLDLLTALGWRARGTSVAEWQLWRRLGECAEGPLRERLLRRALASAERAPVVEGLRKQLAESSPHP